jgi:hypothetical protein
MSVPAGEPLSSDLPTWPGPGLPRSPVPPAVGALEQALTYAGLARHRLRRRPVEPTKFVVFAQGRTGSTLLVDLLDHLDGVHCDEEILDAPVLSTRLWVDAHRYRHPDAVYGFKVKIVQLVDAQRVTDPAAWLTDMHRRGWRVIHLWRRNLLRQVLSTMLAERRGSFVFRDRAVPALDKLVVDPAHLRHWMRVLAAVSVREREVIAAVPHTTVCYEDDLEHPDRQQATLDRLAAFLSRPTATARTEVKRTAAGPISDVVANVDDIERLLRGTEWESFLG